MSFSFLWDMEIDWRMVRETIEEIMNGVDGLEKEIVSCQQKLHAKEALCNKYKNQTPFLV